MGSPTERATHAPWWERAPSWTFLLILAGLFGVAVALSLLLPTIFWNPPDPAFEVNDSRCPPGESHLEGYGFFYDYYWGPILCDEGYTVVNTATWAVLLGLLLMWAYRLTKELHEHVNLSLILAVVPYLVWGSVYRVLEDSDLFAPFNPARPGAPQGSGFLDQYLGVFFVTPIIYVEVTFIAVALLLWGHKARDAAERGGLGRGLQYYALSLLVLLSLYVALWASEPTYMRHVANPLVAFGAALIAFLIILRDAQRTGRIHPHMALFAYGIFFLVIGLYYVFRWMTGDGLGSWRPGVGDQTRWWIFGALILGPALVTYAVRQTGKLLARVRTGETEKRPSTTRLTTYFVTLLVVESIFVFATILGMKGLVDWAMAGAPLTTPRTLARDVALLLAAPLALFLGGRLTRRAASTWLGTHPNFVYYLAPVNLLMVFGQMSDALMTSLGIDVFSYKEKHVLPRVLIDRVAALDLPWGLDKYPTAIVMIPLKLLIVLLVVVAVDASAGRELRGRENLVGLVKLGIIMVGLSPGVRDAVRLAMGV